MRSSLLCALVVAASVAAGYVAPTARTGVPVGTFSGCPRDARSLPSVWPQGLAAIGGGRVLLPGARPPHNPVGHCNACARLVFLASRTLGGWTVWGRY